MLISYIFGFEFNFIAELPWCPESPSTSNIDVSPMALRRMTQRRAAHIFPVRCPRAIVKLTEKMGISSAKKKDRKLRPNHRTEAERMYEHFRKGRERERDVNGLVCKDQKRVVGLVSRLAYITLNQL